MTGPFRSVSGGGDSYMDAHLDYQQKDTAMNFGQAIEAAKGGAKVCRSGWNGKGMWVCLSWSGGCIDITADKFWSEHTKAFATEQGGSAKVQPYFIMKTAAGELQSGWLASQSDMLADDWQIV